MLAARQSDYNEVRPHSAHGGLTPASIRLRTPAATRLAGTEKRHSTEPRNTVTMGVTATRGLYF